MEQGVHDLEALLREEKRLTSIESHSEAWADGRWAGIEPEIIAEAALSTAFFELVQARGEEAAISLVEKMRDRIASGEFEASERRH